ncbi:hypothetical protein C8A01DRAFT_12720 [Parachaetomium inaequale]|uniref:Uncharacterized protein n=1 Tax=Parachaetomium inaequale TaxID=2588326 RepID=A0AAN6SVL0_9PEZI|nr:hypothetical protein C8A01DRAFT_12720 [Parachaetomium inaequale]
MSTPATSTSGSTLPVSTAPTSARAESAQDQDTKTPIIRFTNTHDLFQCIDEVSGDILTVTDVSRNNLCLIEKERESQRRKFRLRRYDSDSRILIITIPTRIHEELHSRLNQRLIAHLARHGLDESWDASGSPTCRAAHGHPGGDGGEGDSTGGPELLRGGSDDWPTLVIEAGDSESLAELRLDMRWWFAMSEHQVKIVLLAKFDHSQQMIFLEKWEEEIPPTRPGATTTRSFPSLLRPTLRQEITIRRDRTTVPVSYRVTSGALVLGFRLLFLRDPGPGEGDIVISIAELERYGGCVWRRVQGPG